MLKYANLDGKSSVRTYEISESSITVGFAGNALYLYDFDKPGRLHVEEMIKLAEAGRGLAAYISKHVKKNYAAKLP